MKRLFIIFFALLLGITAAFAQTQPTLPYQAVVRDNQNHLLKDADVSIDVQIYEGATLRYSETQTPHSNANGLISFNIGAGSGATGTMADVADWRVAKFKFTYHLTDGDVVVTDSVHAVPYALQTAFTTGGNFLTSDSAVITTMQGNIATNTTDIAALANRVNTFNTNVCDSVKDCDFSGNASIQNMLQELSDLISAQNHKIDSLAHIVDSLSNLPHGGGDTPATFTCGTSKVKDVDNNEYNTVKIGSQCWTKENLRTDVGGGVYPKKNGGNDDLTPDEQVVYGRLYTWNAMMKGAPSTNYPAVTTDADTIVHGICPAGWHVPSDAEWDTLTYYVFNSTSPDYKCGEDCGSWSAQSNVSCIAKALSSTTGWSNTGSGCNAGNTGDKANATGFSAVPAGGCVYGNFINFGNSTYFWSATQGADSSAGCRELDWYWSTVGRYPDGKDCGYSVRCLRDAETGGGDTPGDDEPTIVDTVTCYPNLGSNVPEKKTVTRGENLDLSTTFTHPAETNWEIAGWNTSADGTGTSYTNTITTSGNLTLYAQWHTFCTGTPNTSVNEFGSNRIDSLQDADNNKYTVVQIGNQCWMKENLRTTKKPNNEAITEGMWTPGSNSVETYGRLYDWTTMMNGGSSSEATPSGVQGICPAGWHVPSNAEWDMLTYYVYYSANPDYKCAGCSSSGWNQSTPCIAKALSSTTGWNSNTESGCNAGNRGDKSNLTGFSAVPAGCCFLGNFFDFGSDAYFWSATEYGDDDAWGRGLTSNGSHVYSINNGIKDYGYSVRCLRD